MWGRHGVQLLSYALGVLLFLALAPLTAPGQLPPVQSASANAGATVPGDDLIRSRISVGLTHLHWSMTGEAPLERKPCATMHFETSQTTICLDAAQQATVSDPRYQESYVVPVEHGATDRSTVSIRRSDLMIPNGPAEVDVSCAGCASEDLRVRVAPRRWSGCSAGPVPDTWKVMHGPEESKAIAITLDDGPSPFTDDMLEVLDRHSVPATFYVMGSRLSQRPAMAQQVLRRGHSLGNHTWTHADLRRQRAGVVESELQRTSELLRRTTGSRPCTFRAPYGEDPAPVVAAAERAGMVTVGWNADSKDWELPSAAAMTQRVLGKLRPGAIILLHDGGGPRERSVVALERIITAARDQGYRFKTTEELLGLQVDYAPVS